MALVQKTAERCITGLKGSIANFETNPMMDVDGNRWKFDADYSWYVSTSCWASGEFTAQMRKRSCNNDRVSLLRHYHTASKTEKKPLIIK